MKQAVNQTRCVSPVTPDEERASLLCEAFELLAKLTPEQISKILDEIL